MKHELLLATATLTTLLGGNAGAQDAVVPTDFASISQAIQSATDVDGDGTIHIFVEAGTYSENVFVQNRANLRIEGAGAASTTIQGAGGHTVNVERCLFFEFSGFTVSGGGTTGDGIELSRCEDSSVTDIVATGNLDGITLNDSTACVIAGNTSTGNASTGIKLNRGDGHVVTMNSVTQNGSNGIDLDRVASSDIVANDGSENQSSGIRVRRSIDVLVEGNTTNGNLDNGIRVRDAFSLVIRGNVSTGNVENGMRMRRTFDSLVTQNQFTGNGEFGIRRRAWTNDDFDEATSGVQDPAGDNDLSGNTSGPLRED